MTEMTDLSSDLEGSGIPFLDYRTYAERVFFPGHGCCPLQPVLGGPGEEGHRAPVRQGLTQLSNLLNCKLFLLTVRTTQARGVLWHKWGLLDPFQFSPLLLVLCQWCCLPFFHNSKIKLFHIQLCRDDFTYKVNGK